MFYIISCPGCSLSRNCTPLSLQLKQQIVKGVTWTNQLYRHQSKMSSPKTIYLKRDYAAYVYLSEAPFPPMTPYPPPPHFTHCIRVYCILIHTGRRGGVGGRVEPERRLEEQRLTKLGRQYH